MECRTPQKGGGVGLIPKLNLADQVSYPKKVQEKY